jgi:hypothetical protein
MGRAGAKSSKAAAARQNNPSAGLFDSTELRVQHTEQLRQVSDGILELTQGGSGVSSEFALGHAPSSSSVPAPLPNDSTASRARHTSAAKGGGGGQSRHGSTTAAVKLSSPVMAGPSKRKQPKSRLSSSVERSDPVEARKNAIEDDDRPANPSTPVLDNDKDDGDASQVSNLSSSSPRKEASRGGTAVISNDGDIAGDAHLPPGAYSVRPGVSTSVLDDPESESECSENDEPVLSSGSRSVDSSSPSLALSTDATMVTAPTVTATAVTRDDLEQEVRERILREAVVAEVMVAVEAPNATAAAPPQPQSQLQSQPVSVPDGFFTSPKPSVPDSFFTSPDSTASFSAPPESPLDRDADKNNSRKQGGCASCSPCWYTWRWWLIALLVLLLVMGALGVVFGVVLPSQSSEESKKKGGNQLGSNNHNGGVNNLRRTSAPSQSIVTQAPSVLRLTQEPTDSSGTSITPQPAPATSATSVPLPTGTPATAIPAPAPTSATPWTASTLLQFLMDNTMDGGMGLTMDGTPAKDAYDAIVASNVFTSVPLNGLMVDVFSLMCFYLLTDGANTWFNHQGWGEDPNACEWYGVTCNADGRVARLVLPSNGIRGGLSLDINNLKEQLTYLDVSGNQLKFDRSNLSGLYRLQHLNVSQGGVSVNLDSLLGSDTVFQSLQVLDVSSNSMFGPIPTNFGTMTQLRRFLLQSNQFTGSIPTELAQLTNLVDAKFEGNGFSGLVPDGLCQLKASSGTSLLPKLSVDCAEASCSVWCCTCF